MQSSTVAEQLLSIYEGAGFQVHTGWNSNHMDNWRDAPCTNLKKNEKPLNTGGGGLSWNEIPCIELIGRCLVRKRILVIGNSFGWSTLLLSLLWPDAKVVAMDIGYQPPGDRIQALFERSLRWLRGDEPPIDTSPTYGIELTNELARAHNLNAHAILSASPQDVARVAQQHLGGAPDFVFIDGYHIPPQVILDFNACRAVAAKDCVYLFHDIVNWELRSAFETCQQNSKLQGGILWRTPTGMGLLYPEETPEMKRVFRAYSDDEAEMARIRSKLPRWKRASRFERAVLHNKMLKRIKDLLTGAGKRNRT